MNTPRNESSAVVKANDFIARLKKKNSDENRIKVAHQLHKYINGELRDNSPAFINEFIATFDARADQSTICDLISSNDNDEKKAGIFMIVCLVDSAADESKRIPRFAKYLLKALTNSDDAGMKLAARAIAYLIQTSKTFAVELVEKSLNQVCEWLEEPERHEQRRLAAVLLARQLAHYTSTSFFLRASEFFNNIFKVLRDPKVHVRVNAARSLHSALSITARREAKQKSQWYRHCYDEAVACLSYDGLNKDERQHPTLLVLNELLRIGNVDAERKRLRALGLQPMQNVRTVIGSNAVDWLAEQTHTPVVDSQTAKSLIAEKFSEICDICHGAAVTRLPYCQAVLLEIFPRLTSFKRDNIVVLKDPIPFYNHAVLLTPKHNVALFTIGLLFLDRPTELRPKLPQLLGIIRQMLQNASVNNAFLDKLELFAQRKKTLDENVFICLTLIVRAMKTDFEQEMRSLLPLILDTGLSRGLTDVMFEVMKCIPDMKTEVQDGLLKELCQLLMNRKLPSKLDPPTSPPVPSGPVVISNVALTTLALQTLGRFEFQRHALQMFIKYIAQGYLMCDCKEVRLASVECCAKMLVPFVRVFEVADRKQRGEVIILIRTVLRQLVCVAVTDLSVHVRLCVLRCFKAADKAFLSHLAQADMLELIFMCLHDEKLEMQQEAVALLGKLADLNPAFVLPRLRKVLLETLSQLQNSRVGRSSFNVVS
ncbi:hypothetical protein AB6A40_004650 [Gnathostoma spinigerum]|uniref:Uncharacterized protein n=1 Tax=Gnathostoma spinigerum TaxID=75299 RepID=A0ABD6EFE7_9BILA